VAASIGWIHKEQIKTMGFFSEHKRHADCEVHVLYSIGDILSADEGKPKGGLDWVHFAGVEQGPDKPRVILCECLTGPAFGLGKSYNHIINYDMEFSGPYIRESLMTPEDKNSVWDITAACSGYVSPHLISVGIDPTINVNKVHWTYTTTSASGMIYPTDDTVIFPGDPTVVYSA
jgi:hypothetical protein